MPAPSERPIPSVRMVELLAKEKIGLIRTGFPFDARDDPEAFGAAARLDVYRCRLRTLLQELRDDDGPVERIAEVQAKIKDVDGEWFELLHDLPAMQAFEAAWDRSWRTMVQERAWPHATQRRREGRRALQETKPEFRACFLGLPTAFQRYADAIRQDLVAVEEAADDVLLGRLAA